MKYALLTPVVLALGVYGAWRWICNTIDQALRNLDMAQLEQKTKPHPIYITTHTNTASNNATYTPFFKPGQGA